ncbi:unnamed protein product, partial [Polarella glacialis]
RLRGADEGQGIGRRDVLRRWATATAELAAERKDSWDHKDTLAQSTSGPSCLKGVSPKASSKAPEDSGQHFVWRCMQKVKLLAAHARIRGARDARCSRAALGTWIQVFYADRLRRRLLLGGCLQEWRSLISSTRTAALDCCEVQLRRQLGNSLARWRRRTASTVRCRQAILVRGRRLLQRCLVVLLALSRSRRAGEVVRQRRAKASLAGWAPAAAVRRQLNSLTASSDDGLANLRCFVWHWRDGCHLPGLLVSWRHAAQAQRQERREEQELAGVRLVLRPRRLAAVFTAWEGHAAAVRRAKGAEAAAQGVCVRRRLSTVFAVWARHLVAARCAKGAEAAAQRQRLRAAMGLWVASARSQGRLASLRSGMRRQLLYDALACWIQLQGRCRAAREVQSRASLRQLRESLRPWGCAWRASRFWLRGSGAAALLQGGALSAWRTAVAVLKAEREALAIFGVRLWRAAVEVARDEFLLRCLRSWRLAAGVLRSRRRALKLILAAWIVEVGESRRLLVARCFKGWRRRQAAGTAARVLLAFVLDAWQRALTAAAADMASASLRRSLLGWRDIRASAAASRRLGAAALGAWRIHLAFAQATALWRSLHFWRRAASLLAVNRFLAGCVVIAWREAVRAERFRSLQRCLRLWIRTAQQSAAFRRSAGELLRAWREASMVSRGAAFGRLLRRWQCSAALTAGQRQVLTSWLGAVLAQRSLARRRCFRVWRGRTAAAIDSRNVAQGALHGWRQAAAEARRAALRRSLCRWRQAARLAVVERCLQSAAIVEWRSAVLAIRQALAARALLSWRAAKVLASRDCWLVAESVACWRAALDERRAFATKMRRFWWCCERSNVLAAQSSAREAAGHFWVWRSYASGMAARRGLYVRAMQEARLRPLRLAFRSFRKAFTQQGRNREANALLRAMQRLLQAPLLCSLTTWRQSAALARRSELRASEALRSSLEAWRWKVDTRSGFKAGVARLHRLSLAVGFLGFLRGCRASRRQPIKVSELEAAGAGLARKQLRCSSARFLRAWRISAQLSLMYRWFTTWHREAVAARFARRRACRRPLRLWRSHAEASLSSRRRCVMACSFADRKLFRLAMRHWALAQHGGPMLEPATWFCLR